MQKLNFNINGKHYEATIAEIEHNVAEVELNGKKFTVEVERAEAVVPQIATPRPAAAAAPVAAAPAAAPKVAAGANAIVAPLPGSVVSISVKAGQQLAVIEAMKMENEILAPADGTVKAVHVSAGQAVQQGDALIELA